MSDPSANETLSELSPEAGGNEPVAAKPAPSPLIVGGAVAAVLGPVAVVATILGGVALTQLKAVRAELAAVRDELMLGEERAAKLERQLQQVSQELEKQQPRTVAQAAADRTDSIPPRPAFQLTQDETQLIREYIKASPVSPGTTGSINVGGDLRNAAMLPLPSQIGGKAPRLNGGRFTIDRNGAIVISLRKSRKADAVIQPN
jgi:hypothetical protein